MVLAFYFVQIGVRDGERLLLRILAFLACACRLMLSHPSMLSRLICSLSGRLRKHAPDPTGAASLGKKLFLVPYYARWPTHGRPLRLCLAPASDVLVAWAGGR